jgi:nitrogen fixation negative regulator NifL
MTRARQVSGTTWIWIATTAVAYALLAKLSFSFYWPNSLVSIFWPGAGLALAAVLVGGRPFALGIFLGAYVGMIWTDHAPLPAAILALGSTLEPLFGAWLLTRKQPFDVSLQSSADVLRLAGLAAAISPLFSAALGIGILVLAGDIPSGQWQMPFTHWWLGDALGIVVATPVVLVWRTPPRLRPGRIAEAALLLGLSFLAGQIVFLAWLPNLFGQVNRGYWLFLIIAWVAVRLGRHGALVVLLMVTVQALVGAVLGVGFFGDDLAKAQLVNFWAYTLGLAAVGLLLATTLEERERVVSALRSGRNLYESLFANMLDGVAHCRMILHNGAPVDCEFLTVNRQFEEVSGLDHVAGRTLRQILPGFAERHPDALAAFAQVVQTGTAKRWVQHLAATDRWIAIGAYRPAAGEFIAVVENISDRIRADQELRKLSIAVEQCPVSIVITDPAGSIEYVNPAFTEISGFAAAEVLGRNPRVLQSGRTARSTYEELWATLAAGGVWHGDFINQRKDGRHYYETATISALRQPDGTVTHYVAVKEDTTALKKVISDLRFSEDRLRLAKTAAGLGIFDIDIAAGTMNWDERVRELWEAGPEATVTRDLFLSRLDPADRAPTQRCMQRALDPAGTGEYRDEFRLTRRDGGVRHIAAIGQAFFEGGRAVRLVGTVQDVSMERQRQREEQERRGEMELLINQQVAAQTAAAIAHELNQPLVAISAYSEAAMQMLEAPTKSPDKLARAVRGAMEQAHRAGSKLHELLDFLHQGESARGPVDLNGLVREAVAIAEESGYGNLHPVLELQPDLRPVMANGLQIQKVLVNLLQNSIEATSAQSKAPADIWITVQTDEARDMAHVTVRDRGPGLSPELLEQIFKPFFTTKPAGVGLGLAISRAMVEAHGGQLWADIDSGPGATFHFVLPFAP